jgi:hypothetical protein
MGKKSRLKKMRRELKSTLFAEFYPDELLFWQDMEGFHTLMPGKPPSEKEIAEITKKYQESLRNSPIYLELIEKFGKEKAEELIGQCKYEVRRD